MTEPILSLPAYYNRRAPEYEQIWHRNDPIRQEEQKAIVDAMAAVFQKKRVLELACGTGYWTQFVTGVAESVLAVDYSDEMLEQAREKQLDSKRVRFLRGDAYALESVPGSFNAALANFWFSHVPAARQTEFLTGLHKKIEPGATVFMADNVLVPGVGGELVRRSGCDDTFKLRTLADGTSHEVLKNYFTEAELEQTFGPRSRELKIHVGRCFWWLSYTARQ